MACAIRLDNMCCLTSVQEEALFVAAAQVKTDSTHHPAIGTRHLALEDTARCTHETSACYVLVTKTTLSGHPQTAHRHHAGKDQKGRAIRWLR